MNATLGFLIQFFAKASIFALVINEVRGLILAVPVLYTLYISGGTLMAIWLAFCSLAGIAMSVVGPMIVAKHISRYFERDRVSSDPAT